MNRREFVTLSAASVSTVLLTNCVRAQSSKANPTSVQLYKSINHLLEISLEASEKRINLGGKQAYLLSYNGQVPAPRLEVKAGDTIRIHLTNNLSQPTNLHYHGLHITPNGHADNAFLSIAPKERLTYEFTLPNDHPSGTFWYHPHHHEYVAEQLFGGLAGFLIVRGQLDEIPEIQTAKEEFLVLQDFAIDANGRLQKPNHMDLMMGREGSLVTVNGQVNSSLSIAKGGLLRLRILNASPSRFYRLSLENHPFYLIATDGGAIAEPTELQELLLAPGERAEVLVRGEREPGQYRLLNLPYNRGGMMMGSAMGNMNRMGMMGNNSMRTRIQTTPQVIATLSYNGSVLPLPLPQKLLPVEVLPEPKTLRRIEMSMDMGSGMGMGFAFSFNGQVFEPKRIDTKVQLNTIEDWEITNLDPSRMAHPFHLHVNPFQIIARNGQPEPYRAWKDTVLVRGGETVRIRIPFRDFSGKTVYHCHILDHEVLGMMGTVLISS